MLVEAIDRPFRFHFVDGLEVRFAPGQPVPLDDDRARRLLDRAPGKVKVVSSTSDAVVDLAAPNARSVYWESTDGRILGPGQPEFLARVGAGDGATFWVIVTYRGAVRWIRSDRLRSRQAWETQRKGKGDTLERMNVTHRTDPRSSVT